MHIALIGATGLVGNQLLKKLLSNPNVSKITSITRRPLESTHDKVNQLVLSKMNPDHIRALKVKADIFICALGTTIKTAGSKEAFIEVDKNLVLAFAQLAKKEQARAFFVVSAMGSDKNSLFFYNKVKGEMEEAVIELEIPATYILRPSLLVGHRKEKRTGESMAIGFYQLVGPLLPKSLKGLVGTEVSDIVNYMEHQIFHTEPGVHKVMKFIQ